jgi:endonuclease G
MKSIRKVLLLALLLTSFNAFAIFDDCKDLFPKQQVPTSPQLGRDLCFDGFAIYYSPQDKKPIYTVQKLLVLITANSGEADSSPTRTLLQFTSA